MNCASKVRDLRCDGHGTFCLPQGICICDSGWTGLNPFFNDSPFNCDVHKDAMLGLAITETAFSALYVLLILQHLQRRLIVVKNFQLFLNDPKTSCFIIFVLIGVCDISLSTSYLANGLDGNINRRMPTAAAAGLNAFFCFSGLSVYFQIQLHFLKSSLKLMTAASRQKILSQLTILRNASRLVVPSAVPISLSSILSVVYPDKSKAFAMTFIIGIGALVLTYLTLFLTALGYVVGELTAHLKTFQSLDATIHSGALSSVCARLKLAYRVGGISMMGGSILLIIFGSWDFLYHKYVYLSFIVRLTSIILFTVLYTTISGVSHSPSTVITSSTPFSSIKLSGRSRYDQFIQILGLRSQKQSQVHSETSRSTANLRIRGQKNDESTGTGRSPVMSPTSAYKPIPKTFLITS